MKIILATAMLVLSSAFAAEETPFEKTCYKLAHDHSQSDAKRLHELFNIYWKYMMTEYPEFATYVGYSGQNDRWADVSLETIERRNRELDAPYAVLKSIDQKKLTKADQINYELLWHDLEDNIDDRQFKSEYLAITQLGGVQ